MPRPTDKTRRPSPPPASAPAAHLPERGEATGEADSVAQALLQAVEAQPPAASAPDPEPASGPHPASAPASSSPPDPSPDRPSEAPGPAATVEPPEAATRPAPAGAAASAPPAAQGPSIDAALEQLSARPDAPSVPLAQSVVRAYTVREVAQLLAAFAAVMLLLDADGLLTWVRRMEVGRAQSAWLSLVAPLQKGLDAVQLNRPRRAVLAASDGLARTLGGGEDPLFAEAWGLVEVAPYLDAMAEPEPMEMGLPGVVVPDAAARRADPRLKPTMLLVGDSMFAGNLAAAIGKAFARAGEVKVVSAYQTATGLSRPDIFDWGRVVVPLVERERPRWVVCSFGANDAQAIRLDDQLLSFGEPAWEAVYRLRVRSLIRQAAAGGARVLWLGLPPMRDEAFDRRIRHLNVLFKREARDQKVDFMELSMLLAGPEGGFATFVSDGQRLVRVRMEDGVHYAPGGAQAIARWVYDWAKEKP